MNGRARRALVAGEAGLARHVAAALAAVGFAVEEVGPGRVPDGKAGETDLVVALPAIDLAIGDFATLAEQDWVRLAEAPLERMLDLLAAVSPRLREPGGTVLIVLPNIGMVGVAGMAAQTMAAEGMRSLAKAVAKAWRPRGIRVNCAILSAAQLASADEELASEIVGVAAATATAGFVATGNSILIDGEQTSI